MANENQDNKNPSQSKPAFWTLSNGIVAFVVCAAVTAPFWYPLLVRQIMNQFFGKISTFSWEKYGQFGDSFGFVTAVFAGAAFFLLLKTYKVQQEELRETRKVMSMHKFEITFFNILNLYSNLSDSFIATVRDQGKWLRGNDAFRVFVEGLNDVHVHKNSLSFKSKGYTRGQEILTFGRQYKIFITLLDFCLKNCPLAMEKERYLKIIFSTFADGEMIMLVANCFIENNSSNKELLNGYLFDGYFYKSSLPKNIIDYLRSLLESDSSKI